MAMPRESPTMRAVWWLGGSETSSSDLTASEASGLNLGPGVGMDVAYEVSVGSAPFLPLTGSFGVPFLGTVFLVPSP